MQSPPEIEKTELTPREFEFAGQTIGMRATERETESLRSSEHSSQLLADYLSSYVYEETTQDWIMTYQKGTSETISGDCTSLRIVHVPNSQNGKIS